MNGEDELGSAQVEQIVIALQFPAMGAGMAFRMKIPLIEARGLQHRAHRPVEQQDAFGQGSLEAGDAIGSQPIHCLRASRVSTSKCGGRRSRVARRHSMTSSPQPEHSA